MSGAVVTAMVLAAGFGKRMRPLTDTVPKPMVKLAGQALVDHVLDRLWQAGIEQAVVNLHYKADVLSKHLEGYGRPKIIFSDERERLLETGGGVVHALPLLGSAPFVVHNSDSVWIEKTHSNISRLISTWNPSQMDCLMLLAVRATSLGYDGSGDFSMSEGGILSRRVEGQEVPYVFAGVSIMKPSLFDGFEAVPFSLNKVWDRALSHKRCFGMVLDGVWMHVGTPEALLEAERLIAEHILDET